MKYEFVILDNDFKNNPKHIYKNGDEDICIDLTDLISKNKKLKSPIGIFINGVLINSNFYKFENKVVTVNKEYPIFPTDRIYMICTSINSKNNGFISQYKINDFTILDDDTITLVEPITLSSNKEVIAVVVNGIVYAYELFTIDNDTITFVKYRPDTEDDVSIMIFEK